MSVLVLTENGKLVKRNITLAEAAIALDLTGKTIVVNTPQVVSTAVDWPADRALRVEKGGSIGNTTAFDLTGANVDFGMRQVFAGAGAVTGLKEARPEWWGAKADNQDSTISSNNVALQAALDASKNILISNGTYKFSASLVLQPDTTIRGFNEFTSKLLYTGSGTAITGHSGYVQFYDFFLSTPATVVVPASPPYTITGNYYIAGTKAFYSASLMGQPYHSQNLVMNNVRMQGFETLIEANGYYWKFFNCTFMGTKYAFNNTSPNNMSFYGCWFMNFQDAVRSYGGAGPISFYGCSFEHWSGSVVQDASGSGISVNMSGCYAEGKPTYDNLTNSTGLANFNAAFVFTGAFTSVNFTGNDFQLQGVRRVFSVTSSSNIISSGNKFYYEAGAASTTECIYLIGDATTMLQANDIATSLTSAGVGAYTTASSSILTAATHITGRDPISKKPFQRSWNNLTPLNGWANTGTAGYAVLGYKIENDRLYLRGQITGVSSTTATIATLPAEALAQMSIGTIPYAVGILVTTDGLATRSFRILGTGDILLQGIRTTTFDIPEVSFPLNP